MELTASAQWINDVFYQLDFSILSFYHSLAESASGILTPVLGTLTLTEPVQAAPAAVRPVTFSWKVRDLNTLLGAG